MLFVLWIYVAYILEQSPPSSSLSCESNNDSKSSSSSSLSSSSSSPSLLSSTTQDIIKEPKEITEGVVITEDNIGIYLNKYFNFSGC